LNEIWNRALEEPRERRRNNAALSTLLTFVDKSVDLYQSLLTFCSRKFKEEGNPLYCTLRADVLMALHDAGVTELYQHDPCHEFCWILDAATRERQISDNLFNDLKSCLVRFPSKERHVGGGFYSFFFFFFKVFSIS
jgi:hypothetical protein